MKVQNDFECNRANSLTSELSGLRANLDATQSDLQILRSENSKLNDVIRVKDSENKRISHEANKRPSRIHYHHTDQQKLVDLEHMIESLKIENSQ